MCYVLFLHVLKNKKCVFLIHRRNICVTVSTGKYCMQLREEFYIIKIILIYTTLMYFKEYILLWYFSRYHCLLYLCLILVILWCGIKYLITWSARSQFSNFTCVLFSKMIFIPHFSWLISHSSRLISLIP